MNRQSKRKNSGYTLNSTIDDIYHTSHRTQEVRLTQAKKQRAGSLFFGLIITLGFFTALTWIGFYFFGATGRFNDTNIDMSIDTPRSIASGDEISLTIHYRNKQDTTLNDVELRIKPPEGFILATSEPKANGANEYHYKWGKLKKDEGGKIILLGTFIGTREGNNELTAYLTYKPENFNSTFEKVVSTNITINAIPLALTIKAPSAVAAGTQVPLELTLKNEGAHDIGLTEIAWTLPDQWETTNAEPKTDKKNTFIIPSIKKGEEWKGTITGIFKNSARGEYQLIFKTYIILHEKQYLQNEIAYVMNVTDAELEATLSVNDFQKKGSVAPGQSLDVKALLKNNGNNAHENARITIEIEEPTHEGKGIINWKAIEKQIKAEKKTEQLANNRKRTTLTWNAQNAAQLLRIEPKASHTESISIPILTPQEFGGALPGSTIIISMSAQSDGGAPIHTAPFEITLRSNADLFVTTQPAGDPLVGVGADGLTEVSVRPHDIQFVLTNSLHEIQTIEIEAIIPDGIVFEKILNVPVGEMQYNASKRKIRWILNKMPTTVTEIPISFRLDTVTPIGEEEHIILISNIELTAIDAVSQEPFKIKWGEVQRK